MASLTPFAIIISLKPLFAVEIYIISSFFESQAKILYKEFSIDPLYNQK